MSFSVGIVGLPNVGKSTLFKSLTKKTVEIAEYPFATIHPNYGTVQVPDKRLEKLAEIIKPEKITPTIIEFVDIAGLVKDAHKGEGLGNQFLAQIRSCDAILEVIRGFENEKVENVLGEINPEKEAEIIKTELLMKDLETLEGIIQKIEKDLKKDPHAKIWLGDKKKLTLFQRVKQGVSQGKLISEIDLTEEEKQEIKGYQFLTDKPVLYILNTDDKTPLIDSSLVKLTMNLKEEEEISELSELEIKELRLKSRIEQIIISCYNILDLITFFTVAGGKEIRAWTLKKGKVAPEAGGVVHSDFQEKFIKAEVIPWQSLVEAGSRLEEAKIGPGTAWPKARELGWLKTVGKKYLVQDGDIIEFKI